MEFYEQEVHRVQLPFSGRVTGVCEERSERKAQQLKRLQEINNRRREEKLHEDQKRLQTLLAVQVHKQCWTVKNEVFYEILKSLNYLSFVIMFTIYNSKFT